MERKIYVIHDWDIHREKVVKLTEEQAKAVEWFFTEFEICDYDIEEVDKMEGIDEP